MASHKFKVGQALLFSPRRIGDRSGRRACQVVRLLPVEGGECQYRIKCGYDNIELIAKESQLSPQQ